jgi:hypothetical protein
MHHVLRIYWGAVSEISERYRFLTFKSLHTCREPPSSTLPCRARATTKAVSQNSKSFTRYRYRRKRPHATTQWSRPEAVQQQWKGCQSQELRDCCSFARIIQDIDRWPGCIKAIVENEGMLVETSKGHGRRQDRAYLGPMHPDAERAMSKSDEKFGGR